jgi:(S)-2-hydroxyglutarate dehydrogenase
MSRLPSDEHIDVVIVGGGIVGLATGADLIQRFPGLKLLVLEKESEVGLHQTGHNSGVIHSGIYYKPGSIKATTCRLGKTLVEQFCREHGVAYDRCGKVIVATEPDELPRLQALAERGVQNGVKCEVITRERLRELEPNVTGLAAIHVPEAGRADYSGVVSKLAQNIRAAGHRVLTSHAVTALRSRSDGLEVVTAAGEFHTRFVVNCAGLHSDRVAALTSHALPARIVPFRGEYYQLTAEARSLVNTLVYPVPDPRFPFLGVHFTKTLSGKVKCGPNAVLAFAREGYRKSDWVFGDLAESVGYSGFQRLAAKHWRYGWSEIVRSFWKPAFLASLQRLVPTVRSEHLEPGPTGVRAQAVAVDGSLVDDFCFMEQERVVHVINAPSPGATASLAIGRHIVDRLATRFEASEGQPMAVAGLGGS